jgi:hypothetical protein
LADLAEATGQRYSDLLELREAGWSSGARLGFDRAVRTLKRWADHRMQETIWGVAEEQPKGKVRVPKYETVVEALGMAASGGVDVAAALIPDAEADAKAADLAAALSRGGPIDWAALGLR